MVKYIYKYVLVAEIERLLKCGKLYKSEDVETRNSVLEFILSFINTLEVKEVDLDEEITIAMPHRYSWSGDGSTMLYTEEQMKDFAKHFFELGLRMNNSQQNLKQQQ